MLEYKGFNMTAGLSLCRFKVNQGRFIEWLGGSKQANDASIGEWLS